MSNQNFYSILGIPRNADEDTIQTAYRRLARRYHPDSPDYMPIHKLTFSDITQAYETLRDPIKRAQYDARLHAQTRPPHSPSSHDQYRPSAGRTAKPYVDSPPTRNPLFEILRLVGIVIGILLTFQPIIEYFQGDPSSEPSPTERRQTLDANDVIICVITNSCRDVDGDTDSANPSWRQTQGTVDRVASVSCQTVGAVCQSVYYHFTVNGRTYHNHYPVNAAVYRVGNRLNIYYKVSDPDQSYILLR